MNHHTKEVLQLTQAYIWLVLFGDGEPSREQVAQLADEMGLAEQLPSGTKFGTDKRT